MLNSFYPVILSNNIEITGNFIKKYFNFKETFVSDWYISLKHENNFEIAIIDKRRPKPNVAEVMNLIGEVEGKVAIFIDDMIDTAGTITNGADAIAQRGAKEVYACCSHAVFSDPAIERLEKSALKEVVITDSIALPERKRIDKVKIISVDSVFAAAIDRITNNKSVSELFE